jgi:hypothetical protein
MCHQNCGGNINVQFVSKSVLMLGTAALMAVNSHASTIFIDQFGTTQNLSTLGATSSTVTGSDILGGHRYASLTGHTGVDTDTLNINASVTNELDFSNGTSSSSNLKVIYDGTNNTDGAIHFGLGGVDLTSGGLNSLFSFILNGNNPVNVVFDVYTTDASHDSRLVTTVTGLGDQTVNAPFSSFLNFGSIGGADFTSVSAVTLTIAGTPGLNLALKQGIETTPAPEPASLALTGTGLLGLGFIARKRKK